MEDSLTSTSILGVHVHVMVAMPVRVKPPAEIGETISPTCASLGDDDAVERARMTVLSTALLRSR